MSAKKLEIFDIWVAKTPQHGSWCAGLTLHCVRNPAIQASWRGGEQSYEGANARLLTAPKRVTLKLDGVFVGEQIELFLAIDDDAKKAGTEQAADKLRIRFPTNDSSYKYESDNWAVTVEFNFHD